MSCPSCGAEVPSGARFCPSCGHRLSARGDERRVATVLFADLAGFTGLSETQDPEHIKNLVDRCFARLALDVTGHGGRVDKVVGDAIIALFGAPVAHEDDAERAVRAGLQMQRSIAKLAGELSAALQLRVGINTGEVLVGAIRAGGDYTAMGDVVNVASRLQTLAAPGTVVVGEATHAATSRIVRYEPLGALQARGREERIEAWRAVECISPPGRRPRRIVAPILGRDDELVLLRQSVAMAVHRSRPLVALVLGEAGMGKTRLTEEVARWSSAEHGSLVLEGRCVPYGEANPWWPVAEAVRAACGIEPGDPADTTAAKVRATVADVCANGAGAEAGQIAAGLLHLMGDEEALPDVDPQRARQEARRSLHALVAGLARRQPVTLVLSELHWADDVVLDLLGRHVERLAGLPVVVLAASRPELMERWAPPQGRHNLLTLHLDPLDPRSTRQLALALAEGSLPSTVVDTLVERSGGNPFFLEELVSFVGESATVNGSSALGDLPATLRGLVAARLDSLPVEERSVLEDAAVIGREGSLSSLAALSATRGITEVDTPVAHLLERDLLAVGDDHWEFRSEVVREVVYEILTKSERARRHWNVATWMTGVAKQTRREDEILEQLAHHFATAAELLRDVGPVPSVPADADEVAVKALGKAARWASRRELPLTATRLLDRAVALAAEGSDQRCRLLLDRALERATLRHLDGAREDLSDAFAGSEGGGRARALTILGYVQQIEGDLAASADTLSKALSAWREIGDRAGEGDALRRFGMTCLASGDPGAAESAFEEALAIARDLGSRRDEAWALWHLAELSFYAGRTDEAEHRLNEAGQAFHEAGDTGGIGWVRGLLGYLRLTQGRREEAERLALGILDDLRDRGDRWALAMVLVLLANVRLWQGHASAAVGPAGEARALFAEINDNGGELQAAAVQARALAAAGQAEDAWPVIEDSVNRAGGGGTGHVRFGADQLRTVVATHLGDWRTTLENTEGIAPGLGAEEVMISRGVALLQADRVPEALGLLDAVMQGGLGGVNPKAMGVGPNGWASMALARVCAGDVQGALDASAIVVDSAPVATYRDLALAHLARAFAHHQGAGPELVEQDLESARELVAGTDDLVTAAVVELGGARLGEAQGYLSASSRVEDWLRRLDAHGATADGWDTLIRRAINPAGSQVERR
ncbi:MAG TPA: adenylate/guanylate cyclase domain-containing protein [Acidimicrobiales bacterium]|nr:adenylate/guanylate cyclase domain-containing protein [Acidimicrobiales bacterium]